jgi:hypothetical protein
MPNDPKYWPSGGPTPVPSITSAASAFVVEHSRLLDFDLFASKGMLEKLDAIRKSGVAPLVDSPLVHNSLLLELVLTRTVDNFLCFLTDLLALIYKAKPEMLRSSENEKLDFVLQFPDMDQLRSAIAEKRVERLSYLGLRELSEYIDSQMAFKLFEADDDLHRAALIVELRNLCVHARGVVGNTSTNRFPEMKAQLGKRIELSTSKVTGYRKFLEDCVFDIDLRATSKFFLPSRALPAPPPEL